MKLLQNIKLYKSMIVRISLATLLCSTLIFSLPATVYANVDYEEQMEERKTLPIQTNEIENWPEGPAIGAESAILMEMNTHTILYAKNIHEELYPASTTKIMTCLLAAQNCNLDEKVTFSHNAVYNVPSDGSNMGIDEGETITLEQAMYGVLVGSANEAASAVGEHVAQALGKEPTQKAFAEIMNEKAAQLGCQNTHFTNANGLFDENHYTSAYDLALIGCEFFNNELLCKMSSTPNYNIPPSATQPDDIWVNSKNKLFHGKEYEYEYLLGSKTGFVSQSRQTLVSGAEKNGMKLVCVVFMEETPHQFEDTIKLFNYGFENFKKLVVNENESKYKINSVDSFDTGNDLFGDSTPLMTMDKDAYIILPNTAEFSDVASTLNYTSDHISDVIATVEYTYSGVSVGNCNILFSRAETTDFDFAADADSEEPSAMQTDTSSETKDNSSQNVIFINVKKVIIGILAIAGIFILVMILLSFINSYSFSPRGQSNKRRRKRTREARAAKREAKRNARRQKKLMHKRKKGYKTRRTPHWKTYD